MTIVTTIACIVGIAVVATIGIDSESIAIRVTTNIDTAIDITVATSVATTRATTLVVALASATVVASSRYCHFRL